jgi:hypothetical protein
MTVKEVKPQQATANNSNRYFYDAKKHGFNFKKAEKDFTQRQNRREEIIDDIGELPKPIKVILSFACIGIAIVFAFIEAQLVKATIVGALGISEFGAIIIGFAFASAGIVVGEMLTSSWQEDSFSGKKRPTSKFYIALAFALVYLCGQYFLASRAGIGTSGDMQETVTTLKWFILGLALAEIFFGMAFLSTALKVFTLFIANIRIRLATARMNRASRQTENAWDRYSFSSNGQTLSNPTPAIVDAREYYNGNSLSSEINSNSTLN